MDMNAYIMKRVGIAKALGLIVGLIAFFMIPTVFPDQTMWLRVGIVLWYTTFGAIIGVFGLFDYHPMLKCRMNWWFRGAVFGAWMNLVIVCLKHDELVDLVRQADLIPESLKSPFLFVLAGTILGLVIDGVTTKLAGEGIPGIEPANS